MSYKTELQGNNTDLQTVLSKVNALPDALDTSDATASAGDNVSGKTAYVNGEKVTGTKTLAADTPANATAADIVSGKTAWVNGAKVTGNLVPAEFVTGTVTNEGGSELTIPNIQNYSNFIVYWEAEVNGSALPKNFVVTLSKINGVVLLNYLNSSNVLQAYMDSSHATVTTNKLKATWNFYYNEHYRYIMWN